MLTLQVGEPVELNKKLRQPGEKISIRFLEDSSFRLGSHRLTIKLHGIEQKKWQSRKIHHGMKRVGSECSLLPDTKPAASVKYVEHPC